ncbi:MAG: hypothetical protein AB7I50_19930 [Vicinamibacterales bacterium]
MNAPWRARVGFMAVLLIGTGLVATLRSVSAVLLQSVGGLPPHVTGMFEEAVAVQRLTTGEFAVFDRRAHTVYKVNRSTGETVKLISIGPEQGRLLGPTAFDAVEGTIVVADAPNSVERVQYFNEQGTRLGGFTLPGRAAPRVMLDTLVLSGIGSLQFTGRTLLVNQPETGALVTEYRLSGAPVRTFGTFRATGHETDPDVHLALNVGLPLINPKGGFYFVFQTGEPRFRKYAQDGTLEFERVIQGREIDDLVRNLPAKWPRNTAAKGALPLVPPVVRTAAVDPDGRLWVSFVLPYTYVFDLDGDKRRTVQFRGASIISPTSFTFLGRTRVMVTPGLYEFEGRE